jgi:hypothetical protein
MIITGIADEARPTLEGQLDDAAFDRVRATLERRGFSITCFASAIANWARKITADFAVDVADLRRSVPRMRKLVRVAEDGGEDGNETFTFPGEGRGMVWEIVSDLLAGIAGGETT